MQPSIYNVIVDLDAEGVTCATTYGLAPDDLQIDFSNPAKNATVVTCGAGRHAVYNTASGDFAVFEGSALPEQFLTSKTPGKEYFAVMDKFLEYRADRTTFNICIAPTYACNARCPYCYEAEKHALAPNMRPEVQQRLVEFVAEHYEAQPFKTLDVQWYGGDPQLALDVVEQVSRGLLEFCAVHDVEYSALILTNATLIDDAAAQVVARAGITKALVTVEGVRDLQNDRRPLVDGRDSYEAAKHGIAALMRAGVDVCVTANLDKVSIKRFAELRHEFQAELGLDVAPLKLNDYNASFGCGKFCAPNFDLFTHEEYPFALFDLQMQNGLDAQAIRQILAPTDHFCSGQKYTYLVIDSLGDVYDCDGYMGVPSHKMFSIFDAPQDQVWDYAVGDPFVDPKCRACKILPICMGNCKWERNCCGNPCHPLKHTLPLYLKALAAQLGQ
jgi:uncharacterized protein